MLVPLIHHGLHRNRVRLTHHVNLASRWGGAIHVVEAAWSQVCDEVGLTGGADAAAS